MPETETPVVQDVEASFTLPSVPLREGEKKFEAGLNLEDARRKDSIKEELQRQLRELGQDSAHAEIATKIRGGKAAQDRARLIRNKTRELAGTCLPATVVNLNPVPLELTGGMDGYAIPAAGKGLAPPIELRFRGRVFKGSYMTIRTAKVWLTPIGTSGSAIGDPHATYDAKHIPPIGIAHNFYLNFCSGAGSGQRIGGLLIFEGTIRELEEEHLKRSGRKLKVPRGEWVEDSPGDIAYVNYPIGIEEYLARELDQQRQYAELVIAQGHAYATSQSDMERNQLSNRHRIWHNYAFEMGYITTRLSWANEKLTDSPLSKAVFCPDCHEKQGDPEQHFCRNCNAPFDALKSFLAGKVVPFAYLEVYEGEELELIIAEVQRRKAKRKMFGEDEVEEVKSKGKKN